MGVRERVRERVGGGEGLALAPAFALAGDDAGVYSGARVWAVVNRGEVQVRAAVFEECGGPEVVKLAEVERPAPGPGEVLIQVQAVAMNHLDLWVRGGLPVRAPMPHIGGADIAGVVVALGTGGDENLLGQRVVVDPSLSCGDCEWCRRGEESLCRRFRLLAEHTQGGFAEFAVVPARNLYGIPAEYPSERAAAAPLVFATAWRGLVARARLMAGESVLITGASGGVSTAAVQIARRLGARVFAVTRGPFVDRVRALGAHVVYDRDEVDFSAEVWRDTEKQGVDVVFDSVGEASWEWAVRSLAKNGRLVTYGATTGARGELEIRRVFWRQLQVLGTTMSNRREFREVMSLVFKGELEPVVDVVWPLSRVREAHERLEGGQQFGKIVLTP